MWTRKKGMEEWHEIFGGKLIEGTWGQGPYLEIQYNNWQIVMDYFVVSTGKSAVTYTRFRVAFKNRSDFQLKLSKEGVFSKIGKALGGQDIEVGDELFDEQFRIKSNDEDKARRLLNTYEVKSRINFRKGFHLDIVNKNQMGLKCESGESGLSFLAAYVIKDEVEIRNLFELFQHVLDTLLEHNITTEDLATSKLYKEKKSS
jgi:hypothetical protein